MTVQRLRCDAVNYADLEAPCMLSMPCPDLGLPLDQLLKKGTGMRVRLLLPAAQVSQLCH